MLVHTAFERDIFRPDDRLADIAHPDRSTIAIGNDLVVPLLGRQKLVVGLQSESLRLAEQVAFWLIQTDIRQRCPHRFEIEAIVGQLRGIELNVDRRLLLAANAHQPDARLLRQLLGDDALGVVIHGGYRQDVRGQAQHVRGIRLMIGGLGGLCFGNWPAAGLIAV
jgi:hypothetical protein